MNECIQCGNPKVEIWKDVPGYVGHYLVSSLGRVKSLKRGHHVLSPATSGGGYLMVHLSLNSISWAVKIHRLVANAFLSNPNNLPILNHKNGIRADNRAENLEWCTQAHNVQHAFLLGRDVRGSKNNFSKLTEENVIKIRSLQGMLTQKQIGEMFNVSRVLIGMIYNGKAWKHIQ